MDSIRGKRAWSKTERDPSQKGWVWPEGGSWASGGEARLLKGWLCAEEAGEGPLIVTTEAVLPTVLLGLWCPGWARLCNQG